MSIEEKNDEVNQLITIGRRGYLLYDEVNELLPSRSPRRGTRRPLQYSAGIEVIDSDQEALRDDADRPHE